MAKRIVKPATRTVDEDTGEIIITPAQMVDETTPQEIADSMLKAQPVFFKTPWNHDTNFESDQCGLTCRDPTKTQQHLAADQDINNILRKFTETQDPRLLGEGQARYLDIAGDGTTEIDLTDYMVTSFEVEQAWNQLPDIAKELLETPQKFEKYVTDALANGDRKKLERVGLVPEPAPRAPEQPITPGGASSTPQSAEGPPSGPKT